jgi:hypothetical protein
MRYEMNGLESGIQLPVRPMTLIQTDFTILPLRPPIRWILGPSRGRRLLLVVSDLAYSSTLKTEATCSTETLGCLRNAELYNAELTLRGLIVFSVRQELKFKDYLGESVAWNG